MTKQLINLKKLKPVQVENNFETLKIFENNQLNILLDVINHIMIDYTEEPVLICGSLAKMFSGSLSEGYTPKDIDIEVSKSAFVILTRKLNTNNLPDIVMVEKKPERIILYTTYNICIELWLKNNFYKYTLKKFKNKIPFTEYGSKI